MDAGSVQKHERELRGERLEIRDEEGVSSWISYCPIYPVYFVSISIEIG